MGLKWEGAREASGGNKRGLGLVFSPVNLRAPGALQTGAALSLPLLCGRAGDPFLCLDCPSIPKLPSLWGGRPLLPLRVPPALWGGGIAEPLGIAGAGGLTLSTEAPTAWTPVGRGHRDLQVLRASRGPQGPHGAEMPGLKAWRLVGGAAGILGSPLGQSPQGSLCSAGKQPAFQESASGWGQGGRWGEPSKPRAGSPLQGPPWGLGIGPRGPSAELGRPFAFRAGPPDPCLPRLTPQPCHAPLAATRAPSCGLCPTCPSRGPRRVLSWAPGPGDTETAMGSGIIYCCSFLSFQ